MSNDDDMLAEYDLSAWDVPPPPADLADAVIDRMGGTDVGIVAVPVESAREPRRAWIIAGVAVAVVVLALGVWSLVRSSRPAAPASGGVVAEKARTLSLDTVHADLDAGADVRWKRTGDVLYIEQRAGRVAWRVDSGEKIVIDAGATSASVEATGANLRVEVQMNATDARVIGASALTAAAVAMVTVVVYEGHVKVGRPGQQTVVVAPGTTYQVGENPAVPVVGGTVASAPIGTKKVAVLGLELIGKYGPDAPVVTMVLNTTMREAAKKEGPFAVAPNTDKELVDEKIMNNCASESPQCMAAIGANLGVDKLAFGKIEQTQQGYRITVKLLDVAKKSIEGSGDFLMPTAEAEAEGLDKWGREVYLRLVGVTTTCDADALKDEGMNHVNMGQHAAALAKFEEALACKRDQYVLQLVFMEACASGNSAKASQYYPQLTPSQQTKFAQMCIRNKTDYHGAVVDTPAPSNCDEVSCVLNNYEGKCCEKFKQPAATLSRADITDGIAKAKPQLTACKSPVAGKLKARVNVNPQGNVTSVAIESSPHADLTGCVRSVLEKAKFAATKQGGAFSYPFVFRATPATVPAPPNCDADDLKDQGMQNVNMGQHAAALSRFEASLRCKRDQYVVQLAYMESCASRNSPKAKLYYKQLTAEQQAKFAQLCIRNQTAYEDAQSEHGWLQVFSKPQASILVDGKDTGFKTPITGQQLQLAPGKHKITFVIGDDRFTYSALIKAGATETMSKDLQ
ncbi:MAG TPA: hypothetical protein VIV11_26385 [Kofleriaceae bacterium]